jgi:hypothetical protein
MFGKLCDAIGADFPGGSIYVPSAVERNPRWVTRGRAAIPFLRAIQPFVRHKQRQVAIGLAFAETISPRGETFDRSDSTRLVRWQLQVLLAEDKELIKRQVGASSLGIDTAHAPQYYAGLFDGEGCVSIPNRVGNQTYLHVILGMYGHSCWDLHVMFPEGDVASGSSTPQWNVAGKRAQRFLAFLLPNIRHKARQVEIGLEFIALIGECGASTDPVTQVKRKHLQAALAADKEQIMDGRGLSAARRLTHNVELDLTYREV